MSGGLQAPCLSIPERGGCARGDECGAPSSFGDLRIHFPPEGPGAAPSWEEPEASPKTGIMEVLPEAKGNDPTHFLEGSFEFGVSQISLNTADSTNARHQPPAASLSSPVYSDN